MKRLNYKWSNQSKPSISEHINDNINPKGALKPRVQVGIKKLQLQI